MNYRLTPILSIAAIVVPISTFAQSPSATSTPSSTEVSCSLTPEQLQKRRQELIPGLIKRAQEVTDLPNGLRLRFDQRAGLLNELANVIEQEQDCCNFLRFELSVAPNAGDVTFEVTGPAGTREMLRAL